MKIGEKNLIKFFVYFYYLQIFMLNYQRKNVKKVG